MKLTAKQEAFAQGVVSGMTQADAYRAAYGGKNNWAAGVLWVKASELARNGKVLVRIAELKAATVAALQWTRDDSVRTLRDVVSAEASRPSEKVAAVKELNSMHGFNEPVKHDVRVVGSIKMVPLGR